MLQGNARVRNQYARQIVEFLKSRTGLPFTTRDITRRFSKGIYALGMRELLKSPALEEYPPLGERSRGLVSQFEHSMIVTKDGPLVYTRHPDDTW
jgi:methionyl aminopeptidase